MSVIDEVLEANARYAQEFKLGGLPQPPARKLAIVACMDARLDVEPVLGLAPGDAIIIRNAGGIVTEDVLRSLIVAHHLLGVEAFMIVNHTGCGMMTFSDQELRSRLMKQTGTRSGAVHSFYAFRNLEQNVREQIQRVRWHPWLPADISVRGFIYEVETGRLREVLS
ncbi:MAG TPA: carbonic anhydrase [Ardenticatenaceae bacterium]|nr:carbonic anhydrase [Ardenticatenaceae bacterium]